MLRGAFPLIHLRPIRPQDQPDDFSDFIMILPFTAFLSARLRRMLRVILPVRARFGRYRFLPDPIRLLQRVLSKVDFLPLVLSAVTPVPELTVFACRLIGIAYISVPLQPVSAMQQNDNLREPDIIYQKVLVFGQSPPICQHASGMHRSVLLRHVGTGAASAPRLLKGAGCPVDIRFAPTVAACQWHAFSNDRSRTESGA